MLALMVCVLESGLRLKDYDYWKSTASNKGSS
jgi:hypothetical protein